MPPVADPVDEAAEEATEEVATEEVTEEPTPEQETRTEKILTEIKDKLDAGGKNAPSQEEIQKAVRERIKAETGMTDKQIDYMDNRISQIVAPLNAKTVYNEWKESKGADLTPEIEKGMKEYLKGYAPQALGDKTLLENVFFMELGKVVAKSKKAAPKGGTTDSQIISRRIMSPAPATGLTGKDAPKTGASSLTKEELAVATKMRMTPEEYAAAKGDPTIARLKIEKK